VGSLGIAAIAVVLFWVSYWAGWALGPAIFLTLLAVAVYLDGYSRTDTQNQSPSPDSS